MAQTGGSRVGFRAAMRARDVSRPRPEDEAAVEERTETPAGRDRETTRSQNPPDEEGPAEGSRG
ncbi:MAG: hypothetical protein GEV03_18980 [Streptosporangiales bacterium]|nr:hypothetical protein [Streptosporangiales bacterium]